MREAVVAVVLLAALAVGIFSSMAAVEKDSRWFYAIPLLFGVAIVAIESLVTGQPFDKFEAAFLSLFGFVLGWAQVRIDPNYPKQ